MTGQTIAEMPKYKCHKEVYALKIKSVVGNPNGSADLFFFDAFYAPITVSVEYISKHRPKEGGYYVVYEDGYESWSPADAFENGYTKIED